MSNGAWLTKSRFLAGKQCPKRLWQQCHSPLETGNDPSPITETGIRVGRLAHQLFPNGAVAWNEGQTVSQAIAATVAFVKDRIHSCHFRGSLDISKAFCACRYTRERPARRLEHLRGEVIDRGEGRAH